MNDVVSILFERHHDLSSFYQSGDINFIRSGAQDPDTFNASRVGITAFCRCRRAGSFLEEFVRRTRGITLTWRFVRQALAPVASHVEEFVSTAGRTAS